MAIIHDLPSPISPKSTPNVRKKKNLERERTSGICCRKYGNFWPVVCSLGGVPPCYHGSVPRSVGRDGMHLNGRLALAQSRSHRSCQRNRGNFCLINDIDFDIFPRPRRPPLAPGFFLRVDILYGHRSGKPCRRKLMIVAQG